MNESSPENYQGLKEDEARRRLEREGFNELPGSKKKNIFELIFSVMKEPMFLLLISCSTIYFMLGDMEEAILLLISVLIIISITIIQEGKTEKALNALKDLSSPIAIVKRDGELKRIPGREVVREDIIFLKEGDRVPADGSLLHAGNLKMDESLLTGESFPVSKASQADMNEQIKKEDISKYSVFAGSLIVSGEGIARVSSTGIFTEIGKIGKSLQNIVTDKSGIQKETAKVVRYFFILGFFACSILVISYGIQSGKWLDGFLSGLTLAISLLPEEFPVVLTVFLSIGAYRLSKYNVLARKIGVIEGLGSADVICSDKTGTLTLNQMTIEKIMIPDNDNTVKTLETDHIKFENEEDRSNSHIMIANLMKHSVLSSKEDPFDPMEKAILRMRSKNEASKLHYPDEFIKDYPLSEKFFALTKVWKNSGEDLFTVSCKGAPEAVISLCDLQDEKKEKILERVQTLASQGLRILAVAGKTNHEGILPGNPAEFRLEFMGLLGFMDPIRQNVVESIRSCYSAGIRVVMITGDYPDTARAIAKKIGIKNYENVVMGHEINKLSPEEFSRTAKNVNIFSRVIPEQKLKIIQALKDAGETVSMTGDGVNDAPALKAAHIGIAMGKRGTDVAREASDIVLMDDDFSSIVRAIRAGRRIFDNLKKAAAYILSVHVPIVGVSLIPVMLGHPLVFYPVHIVFWELIIDPACSLVFEAEGEEMNIMNRPPRKRGVGLFNSKLIFFSLLQGLSVFGATLSVYFFSFDQGCTTGQIRSLTFVSIIAGNLMLIFSNRSWESSIIKTIFLPNRYLWWVFSLAIILLITILYFPFVNKIFYFEKVPNVWAVYAFFTGAGSLLWFEFIKLFYKSRLL